LSFCNCSDSVIFLFFNSLDKSWLPTGYFVSVRSFTNLIQFRFYSVNIIILNMCTIAEKGTIPLRYEITQTYHSCIHFMFAILLFGVHFCVFYLKGRIAIEIICQWLNFRCLFCLQYLICWIQITICYINVRENRRGQSSMGNLETLAELGTQDIGRWQTKRHIKVKRWATRTPTIYSGWTQMLAKGKEFLPRIALIFISHLHCRSSVFIQVLCLHYHDHNMCCLNLRSRWHSITTYCTILLFSTFITKS